MALEWPTPAPQVLWPRAIAHFRRAGAALAANRFCAAVARGFTDRHRPGATGGQFEAEVLGRRQYGWAFQHRRIQAMMFLRSRGSSSQTPLLLPARRAG